MTPEELDDLLEAEKVIEDDIVWGRDQDHSLGYEFRVRCKSDELQMMVIGSCCRAAEVATLAIIIKPVGRVYGLDLGKDHRNSDGKMVGEKHKHKIQFHDPNHAYVPDDITAQHNELDLLWEQFCKEAGITHRGEFKVPEEYKLGDMFHD